MLPHIHTISPRAVFLLICALFCLASACGDTDYGGNSNVEEAENTSNGTTSNATSGGTGATSTSTSTTETTGNTGGTGTVGSNTTGSNTTGSNTTGTTNTTPSTARVPLNHRPDAMLCDDFRSDRAPDEGGNCTTHESCDEGANGRCWSTGRIIACTYDECFDDDECADGGVCVCGDDSNNNRCMRSGDCRVDADCGTDGYCSPSYGSCGDHSGVIGFFCHTPEDECIDDADCGGGGAYCAWTPAAGYWKCSNAHCDG